MSLGTNLVFLAKLYDRIDRRTTGYKPGIALKSWLPLLRLKRVPIKRNNGIIKEILKMLSVKSASLLVLKLIKVKGTASKPKGMLFLLHPHVNIGQRFAIRILKIDNELPFSVLFDIPRNFSIQIGIKPIEIVYDFFYSVCHIATSVLSHYTIKNSKFLFVFYEITLNFYTFWIEIRFLL